jgi:transcriptional regulator with XRE-family HTH domain
MDREVLAAFLRGRRAQVRPSDVGLEAGRGRRTPGLRREEVARLAAISVDYYIRLEQARGPRPSRQVLSALARALRLSDDERAYLFNLVGASPSPPGPSRDVPPGIVRLLQRLDDTPAYVVDAKFDILAWNDMAAALVMDWSAVPPKERNAIRWLFVPPRELDAQHGRMALESVADLRAAAARYPDDDGIAALVGELTKASPYFAELWSKHEVKVRRGTRCAMVHPVVGPLELDIETLVIPERDQRLMMFTAAPGTPSHEALRLLRVVGVQDLTSSERR